MTQPDPRPAARIIDLTVTRRKLLRDQSCRACARRASEGHHLIPKGERGDDVVDNIIPLCQECHGALHGNPYTFLVQQTILHESRPPRSAQVEERRDAEWVRRRIGASLRPEELMYVGSKLRAEAGAEYLKRHYHAA